MGNPSIIFPSRTSAGGKQPLTRESNNATVLYLEMDMDIKIQRVGDAKKSLVSVFMYVKRLMEEQSHSYPLHYL